jgi:tetratricopeptide (TPR) repeat protein
MNRLHRLVALLAVALLSACATGPGGESSFNYRLLDDRESGLAYAVRFAGEVQDAGRRSELLVDIADGYAELGLASEAQALYAFVFETIATAPEGAAVSPAAVRLARSYLDRGMTARAITLLEEAVSRVGSLGESRAQAQVLEDVIDISFETGDELFDVLRAAIEAVFVIEDLGRRVDILAEAAVRYQAQGVRQSANVLIQQAIPAAGNIADPWARAAAFAEIARAYRAIGETERADRMIGDGISAAREADAAPADAASAFLSRLVALERRLDALDLAEGIQRPAVRAVVLAAIAEGYNTEDLRPSGFILYARAVSAAGRVDDAGVRAGSYLHVAESYLRFGEDQLALIQASNAVRSLAQADSESRDSPMLERLVDLFLAVDAPSELSGVSDLAPTASTRALVSAHVAVAAEGTYMAVAVEHLQRARQARAEADGAQNAASRDIARAAARLGRIGEAMDELETMDNARHTSAAVISIGYEAMRSGGLTDDQRARLEELYRAYRQRQRLG